MLQARQHYWCACSDCRRDANGNVQYFRRTQRLTGTAVRTSLITWRYYDADGNLAGLQYLGGSMFEALDAPQKNVQYTLCPASVRLLVSIASCAVDNHDTSGTNELGSIPNDTHM